MFYCCLDWRGITTLLTSLFTFPFLCVSVAAIYNIVSQRQMSGRSDSDFSPASNVVPITVEPTQTSATKGLCCQTN